jgi:solute carrier family 12 sodium/potassium/chloride transporter 2
MSTLVTVLTTLSMAAVSTNGEIKGGGIYYIISRTIGPEWGGSIGVVFSFANAGMAALNIVGFAEAVQDLMKEYSLQIIDGEKHDLRVIGIITVVILQAIIVIGMEWEAKVITILLYNLEILY